MNIDDRLRAASRALRDSSVAQVDAASQLREIVRRTGQPVAHGHTAVLRDGPQESPRSLAPSLPPSGKASAAPAGASAAATPTSHWTDGETRSTFHSQPPSGNAVARLLRSTWRYKPLIATAVLLGALLGYGWAARQPTLYEAASQVLLTGTPSISLSGEAQPQPIGDPERYLRNQATLIGTTPVLKLAAEKSRGQATVEDLRAAMVVEIDRDAKLLTISVLDGNPNRAAMLAKAIAEGYESFVEGQPRQLADQLRGRRAQLEARWDQVNAELAAGPNDTSLQRRRVALVDELKQLEKALVRVEASVGTNLVNVEPAVPPEQPAQPAPRRTMMIGMLLGLLASAVLVWWRTRGQGPTSSSSATEQGPEMPRA
jgi:capsular polysaccharide biosynthesis protein